MHVQTGTKHCVMNEDSSTLWHQRLGHIYLNRIKRLVNDGVLSTLVFIDFNTCVDCIKGKKTNKSKKGAKRSSTLLEIIHSDICCPDMDAHSQNTLSPLLMITCNTYISTCFITITKHYMPWRFSRLNEINKMVNLLRLWELIDLGSIMEDIVTICEVSSREWDCCPIYHA